MRRINLLVIHRTEAGHTGRQVAAKAPAAYHLFISKTGNVEWAGAGTDFDLSFTLAGAHAVFWNPNSIGIAVYGCFDPAPDGKVLSPLPRNLHPTDLQLQALDVLIQGLCWWFGIKLFLAGHTELPRASRSKTKVCPGRYLPVSVIRERLGLKLPSGI